MKDIAEQLGRLPLVSDGCAPDLIAWIKNQRRAPDLDEAREAMLEQIPGWSWAPHDDRWDDRADELGRFIDRHHREPRVRADNPAERAIAHWLTRQRRAKSSGTLSHYRVRKLEEEAGKLRKEYIQARRGESENTPMESGRPIT